MKYRLFRNLDLLTRTVSHPRLIDTTMTEANFSGKHLGISGGIILAGFMACRSMQDNGAMSILNVSENDLGPEGAKALAPAM